MATLQALAISGVRSYHPDKLQKINFNTPVTLIHGKNGSGKTTIIQSLKYITTGSFPPNSDRGKYFVMDPRISKNPETVGTVFLRFKTAKGRQIIAKKRCMTQATGKGLSFKSSEQSLKTKDEKNEEIQINQRCADIDKQMPEFLGMTKPILQNIVFCHQDESLWPFADNSALKNIFDELFDTKRFTKAMEHMKDGLKQLDKEKNMLKGQIGHLADKYKKVEELRVNSLNELVKVVEETINYHKLEEQLKPINQKLEESDRGISEINELNRKKGVNQAKQDASQQKLATLQRQLAKYPHKIEQIPEEQIQKRISLIKIQCREKQEHLECMEQDLHGAREREDAEKSKKQIYLQIKRAKQIVKELNHCRQAYQYEQELRTIVEGLRDKEKTVNRLKSQYNQIQIPTIPHIIDEEIDQGKLKEKRKQMDNITQNLWTAFWSLYSQNYPKSSYKGNSIRRDQLENQLEKLRLQIQMKKAELSKFEQLAIKYKESNPELEIFKRKYVGIELQESMKSYIQRKKECLLCTQKLDDEMMEVVKRKMQSTIQQTKQLLKSMQKQYGNEINVDPKPRVKEIKQFLEKANRSLEQLQKQFKLEQQYRNYQKRLTINQELERVLKELGIKQRTKVKAQQKYSLEEFKEIANQYRYLQLQINGITKQIDDASKRKQYAQKIKQEYNAKANKKSQLRGKIQNLEKDLKNIRIIENIHSKIYKLLQQTQVRAIKRQNNEHTQYLSNQSSSENIERYIETIQNEINQKRRQQQYLSILREYLMEKKNEERIQETLNSIFFSLKEAQNHHTTTNDLQNLKNKLEREMARKHEQISSLTRHSIIDIKQEKQYLPKLVRLNAINGLVSDIQGSIKAMDRAISRLHNQKMDEINRILFDLWQDVYHGTDIEFIRINSINEKKNKNGYAYSIVMKKNGELLQMKGRCSMGQKVLASLIIRMALAQAFSANTHIMALDEPTTNLDKAHIQKLAESIGNLLDMQNSRLQLIIISHDIQFIQLLSKYTNTYVQVSRNQSNYSILTKRDINELETKS